MSRITCIPQQMSVSYGVCQKIKIIIFILLFLLSGKMNGQIKISAYDYCPIRVEQRNGTYQILDCAGKIIINDIDSIGLDEKIDRYIVKKSNKYGMLSKYGSEIIPVEFDRIERLFNWYYLVKSNDKYGVYSTSRGKILDAVFDTITSPWGIWVVNAEFTVKKDGKYGIYNGDGNITVPIIYDEIQFRRGVFVLTQNNENHFLINNHIINENIILDKIFQIYGDFTSDNKTFYVFQKGNKQGILDDNGDVFMRPKYEDIMPERIFGGSFSGSYLFVSNDKEWGMVDLRDSIIIPIKYASIKFANPEYLILGVNAKKQLFDLKNKSLITDYNFDRYVNLSKYSRIEKDGLETLIDNETMKMLFPYKYESIDYNAENNSFTVKLNNKYGIIDTEENIIVPIIYDNYLAISCGNKIVIEKDGKYGIIDLNNNVLFPLSARYIIAYSNRFEIIKENEFEIQKYDCNLILQGEN